MNVPRGMTPAEAHVYQFIVHYIQAHDGIAPAVREMMLGCGYKSTSNIARLLGQLERAGHIQNVKDSNCPRGWFPTAMMSGRGTSLDFSVSLEDDVRTALFEHCHLNRVSPERAIASAVAAVYLRRPT